MDHGPREERPASCARQLAEYGDESIESPEYGTIKLSRWPLLLAFLNLSHCPDQCDLQTKKTVSPIPEGLSTACLVSFLEALSFFVVYKYNDNGLCLVSMQTDSPAFEDWPGIVGPYPINCWMSHGCNDEESTASPLPRVCYSAAMSNVEPWTSVSMQLFAVNSTLNNQSGSSGIERQKQN